MSGLSSAEVMAQSKAAMSQWEPRWRKQAEENGQLHKRVGLRHRDLYMRGTGKRLVLVGMGGSFERTIKMLQEYKDDVDVACCDKAFLHLMNHGIVPKYVCVADAMIPYSYAEPHIANTTNTTLLACVTCNPEWARNWKGPVCFYVNKDNLQSERIFAEISGCSEAIPAGSNVGNGLLCFMTQILNYDKYLLIGHDFCWQPDGNYYAFQWEPLKRGYMKQIDTLTTKGEFTVTSVNLRFSARWLAMYLRQMKASGVDVVNCSNPTIVEWESADFEQQLKLARKAGQRPWTKDEKEQYIDGHAQNAGLTFQDIDQLDRLLKTPGMQLLNVGIRGVSQKDVEFANTH